MYLQTFDSVLLHVKIDELANPKGVVIMNHGFSEHLGRYEHLARFLYNNGYNVIRYDLRGHGKSTSKRGYLSDYQEFIKDCDTIVDYAKFTFPNLPIVMIGHSMGGLVSVNYALKHQDKIDRLVLSGPALYDLPKSKGINGIALSVMGTLLPKFVISNPIGDEICSVKEVVEANKSDPLVLKKVSAGMLYQFLKKGASYIKEHQSEISLPLLILHGGDDIIVPQEISESFFREVTSIDKQRIVYPGLYHEIFNENENNSIFETIRTWLEEREK